MTSKGGTQDSHRRESTWSSHLVRLVTGDDGDVVWESVPDQPEQQSDSDKRISTLLPGTTDANSAPDVIKDVAMVREQSETLPRSCLEEPTVREDLIACETGPSITQT